MIDTQDEHLFSNDRMIDNELNHRDYEVNCMRCNKRLKIWYTCPYCRVITFCDCTDGSPCDCVDSRTNIRGIIDSMEQLL